MKKEYVTPVMESEEFVTGEYVAACWDVSCTKCSYTDRIGGSYEDFGKLVSELYNTTETIHTNLHTKNEVQGGSDESSGYFHRPKGEKQCHPVTFELHGNGTSANAS